MTRMKMKKECIMARIDAETAATIFLSSENLPKSRMTRQARISRTCSHAPVLPSKQFSMLIGDTGVEQQRDILPSGLGAILLTTCSRGLLPHYPAGNPKWHRTAERLPSDSTSAVPDAPPTSHPNFFPCPITGCEFVSQRHLTRSPFLFG